VEVATGTWGEVAAGNMMALSTIDALGVADGCPKGLAAGRLLEV